MKLLTPIYALCIALCGCSEPERTNDHVQRTEFDTTNYCLLNRGEGIASDTVTFATMKDTAGFIYAMEYSGTTGDYVQAGGPDDPARRGRRTIYFVVWGFMFEGRGPETQHVIYYRDFNTAADAYSHADKLNRRSPGDLPVSYIWSYVDSVYAPNEYRVTSRRASMWRYYRLNQEDNPAWSKGR